MSCGIDEIKVAPNYHPSKISAVVHLGFNPKD